MSQNSGRKGIKGVCRVTKSEQLASQLDSHHQVYPHEPRYRSRPRAEEVTRTEKETPRRDQRKQRREKNIEGVRTLTGRPGPRNGLSAVTSSDTATRVEVPLRREIEGRYVISKRSRENRSREDRDV
jgi:hypothetical protein